jgi:tetratricopeptide (TPR) repeat protein
VSGAGESRLTAAYAAIDESTGHERAGRFAEARRAAADAAAMLDRYRGLGDAELAILRVQAHVAVGNLDRVLGDLDAARLRLTVAVGIAEAALGRRHRETATAYTALGTVARLAADYDEAQIAYRRALSCFRAETDPLDMAVVLHNLAALEHERGQPEAGIALAERGLALRRSVRGDEHPDLGADLGALGALYLSVGDLDAAEGAYLRALVVLERTLGVDHFEVSVLCGNFGLLLALQGKAHAAEKLYRRALAGKAQVLGDDHPDLAVTLHNLGVLLVGSGRAEAGMAALMRAEALLAARMPADHPRLTAVRNTLAAL